MAYLPPVSLPNLQDRNYSRELYGMISDVGNSYYGARRDSIEDDQWAQEQARIQSDSDRDYALRLRQLEHSLEQSAETADEYFGSPQWYTRDDGSMGFGVLNKAGGFKEIAPPAGADWAPAVTFQDTGTARVPMYTRGGGQAGSPLPVDVAGENRQKVAGTGQGEAIVALPVIEQNADFVLRSIDSVAQDPDLWRVTGVVGGTVPTLWDTDPEAAKRAQSKIDQILGQTFLLAYDKIRGAGQITEYESQRASDALNRLKTQNMSDADYLQTLNEFRNEVIRLVELARSRAAGGQGSPVDQSPVFTTPGGNTFRKIGP